MPERGVYVNPITKSELFIPIAMAQKLIEVGHTMVHRTLEKRSKIGLITLRDPDGIVSHLVQDKSCG